MTAIKTQLRSTLNRDGGDHVNISAYAETDIGKITSPDWRKTFFVPHVGDFINPRAFANWMVSGGREDLRHSTNFYRTTVPLADFRLLILFAKYYQLCGMRANLLSSQKLLNLPWVMYKKHFSGVREFDRWESYAPEVKDMIKFILTNGSKNHYSWQETNPDVINCFDHYLSQITGEDFIPFEELNRIAKEKSLERSAADKARVTPEESEESDTAPSKSFYATRTDTQPGDGSNELSPEDSESSESAVDTPATSA